MKICVERKSEAVLDKKHVLLPLLVMHAGGIITKYKMVHDGTTAYQRIKNKKTKQQDVTVWREGRVDDAQEQSQKKQSECL